MTAYRECLFHSALRSARPTTALGCAQRGVWDALCTQGLAVTCIYSGSCNSSLCTQAYFRYPISTLRPFASFFSAAVAEKFCLTFYKNQTKFSARIGRRTQYTADSGI